MEEAFGADLSGVEVVTDSPRAASMGAEAFTEGHAIHFAPGAYEPTTSSGLELIGHEVAHLFQGAPIGDAPAGAPVHDTGLEAAADRAGARAARGQRVGTHGALPSPVQAIRAKMPDEGVPEQGHPSNAERLPPAVNPPPEPTARARAATIYFTTGDAELGPAEQAALARLMAWAGTQERVLSVEYHGFADVRGGERGNVGLSAERIAAVSRQIEQAATEAGLLAKLREWAVGTHPMGEAGSTANLAFNRRVDVFFNFDVSGPTRRGPEDAEPRRGKAALEEDGATPEGDWNRFRQKRVSDYVKTQVTSDWGAGREMQFDFTFTREGRTFTVPVVFWERYFPQEAARWAAGEHSELGAPDGFIWINWPEKGYHVDTVHMREVESYSKVKIYDYTPKEVPPAPVVK